MGRRRAGDPAAGAEFRQQTATGPTEQQKALVHVIDSKRGVVCTTERRAQVGPPESNPLGLVVGGDARDIQLWEQDTVLRWRFRDESFDFFANPEAAMEGVRVLCSRALRLWGSAAPVTFKFDEDEWDFQIVMNSASSCDASGCTLARSFFPDGSQHDLNLFPQLFTQSDDERVETLCHEFGHVFGLRHFFAVEREGGTAQPFGVHRPQSIMNYDENSTLTDDDKDDLTRLYQMVWDGELTNLRGTRITLVRPFSAGG